MPNCSSTAGLFLKPYGSLSESSELFKTELLWRGRFGDRNGCGEVSGSGSL